MNTLLVIACAAGATYIWRGCGTLFANRIRANSPPFNWTRCMAYAIVGALILKLILYPQGLLSATPLPSRLLATAVGLAVFFAMRRNVPAGSWAGVAALLALTLGG